MKKGQKASEETRRKMSIAKSKPRPNRRGAIHHWWKGGITKKNLKIRMSLEYKLWRKAVFERDRYTCVWCEYKGNKLQADHIKPFALYPELRFAIDNGRTLCVNCHKTTDSYGLNVHTKKK